MPETNTYRLIGLSNGDSNQLWSDVDYAISLVLPVNAVVLPAWRVSPLLMVVSPPKVLLPDSASVCVVPPTVRAVFAPVMCVCRRPASGGPAKSLATRLLSPSATVWRKP